MTTKKLMFTAKWCGACQSMKSIAEEMGDVEIIDVEENPDLTAQYGVLGLPTFILDIDGVIDTKSGSMPKKVLEEFYGTV